MVNMVPEVDVHHELRPSYLGKVQVYRKTNGWYARKIETHPEETGPYGRSEDVERVSIEVLVSGPSLEPPRDKNIIQRINRALKEKKKVKVLL